MFETSKSTVSEAEYAILAAAAYRNGARDPEGVNTPSGWSLFKEESSYGAETDGLHYKVFTKGNELVISFRGTDGWLRIPSDGDDNIAAAMGWNSDQIYLAFKATLDILRAVSDPENKLFFGKNVSFTGHSLGGGLASLMAVWFGREAKVFENAPFEKSAFNFDYYMTRYWREHLDEWRKVNSEGLAAVLSGPLEGLRKFYGLPPRFQTPR